MCRKFSSTLSPDAHAPQESKILDNSAILRIAFGPAAPQAAISTLAGLYYMDPFVEGDLPSMFPCSPLSQLAMLLCASPLGPQRPRRPSPCWLGSTTGRASSTTQVLMSSCDILLQVILLILSSCSGSEHHCP